jgi:hypothetical protein
MSELSKLKQRIRNLETTYNNQKNRALRFEKFYKDEKQKNIELEVVIKKLNQDKETDKHTIEEYKRMIFHKKSKSCNTESEHKSIFNEAKNKKRSKNSYKKPLPKKSEINFTYEYNISTCLDC